ncbi:hypothetical protein [Streptomyces chumphonensis]|uniref:hypothetical protein n=1 Tax=Streptomyces chumphonensis TaxID=1214925 RepID=UPI003D756122
MARLGPHVAGRVDFVTGAVGTGRTATPVIGHSCRLEIERPESGSVVREIVCGHPTCRQRLRVRVHGLREARARRRALWGWSGAAAAAAGLAWTLTAGLLGEPAAVVCGLAGAALGATAAILAFTARAHLGVGRPEPVPTGPWGGTGAKGRHVIV